MQGGVAPRFNDCAEDASPPLDQVISFADGYLQKRSASSGLRCRLLQVAATKPIPSALSCNATLSCPAVVTDLPTPVGHFSGLVMVELVFKCGVPCPPHLPPHVHSDQLSVELSYRGKWLLSEVGTSIYGDGPEELLSVLVLLTTCCSWVYRSLPVRLSGSNRWRCGVVFDGPQSPTPLSPEWSVEPWIVFCLGQPRWL